MELTDIEKAIADACWAQQKDFEALIKEKDATIKRLREALEFVANRKDLMFAECSDAEEIISVCREALKVSDGE